MIIDFTLVLGIDSSAAQAIIKLRDSLANQYAVKLNIFVSGDSEGFPCEINLSDLLKCQHVESDDQALVAQCIGDKRLTGSHVCEDLDEALIYAEVRMLLCEAIFICVIEHLKLIRYQYQLGRIDFNG